MLVCLTVSHHLSSDLMYSSNNSDRWNGIVRERDRVFKKQQESKKVVTNSLQAHLKGFVLVARDKNGNEQICKHENSCSTLNVTKCSFSTNLNDVISPYSEL